MIPIPSKLLSSIAFYDPKRKNILDFGSSRACGCNHNKISIHAEQNAIDYCRKNDKRNNFEIYIWRYTKDGDLKSAHCCYSCTKLINKYGFQNRVYTFDDDNIVDAIVDNPQVSLGYKIKNDL
jgi:deoxycytidylate deaminase